MNPRVLLIGCLSIMSWMLKAQPEVSWSWQLSGRSEALRARSLTGQAQQLAVQDLDTRLDASVNWRNLTGLFALHSENVLSDERDREDELTVQELFWQSDADVAGESVDFSLGKIRLDWGVGYGYRPLNLFKPYQRNPVGIQVEQGAGVAMASIFDETGEWSLIASDASWVSGRETEYGRKTQQRGFGLRRYILTGDSEFQFVAYYDQIRRGLLGGSVVSVLDESREVHASLLVQRQYKAYQQHSPFQPVTLETHDNAYQWLAGFNWANRAGVNIIGEYWYDSRSWNHHQWQQALSRSRQLTGNQQTSALALSYANGLNHPNIMSHNLMFHLSLDSAAWGQWHWSQSYLWLNDFEPTFDMLIAPEDGGVIATQWLDYTLFDTGDASLILELAGRFYTGRSTSVYASFPDKRMLLINLKGEF